MQQRITPNGFPYAPSTAAKVLRKVVKDIAIDSRDYVARGKYLGVETDGEYWLHLPNTYKNVYSAQLLNIAIPYAFDEIASTDTLNITFTGGVTYTGSISIPPGTYTTITSFLGAIETAIEAAVTPQTITISQTATGLVKITPTTGTDTISITGGTLATYMGFMSLPTPAVNAITGNCPANPRPVPYLIMEAEFLNQVDETQPTQPPFTAGNPSRRAGATDSIFTKIDLVGTKNEYIYLSEKAYNFDVTICNPPLGRLQTLHVKFRTHDGRTVDFCGIPHSYVLRLELLDNNFDEYSSSEFTPMR
jgi:hypothetical protein